MGNGHALWARAPHAYAHAARAVPVDLVLGRAEHARRAPEARDVGVCGQERTHAAHGFREELQGPGWAGGLALVFGRFG